MEYIYVKRQRDQKIIDDYKNWFEKKSLEELVELYNVETKCGNTGVHQQAFYLIRLRKKFMERMEESPVYLIEYAFGLIGKIEIINGQIKIVD